LKFLYLLEFHPFSKDYPAYHLDYLYCIWIVANVDSFNLPILKFYFTLQIVGQILAILLLSHLDHHYIPNLI